MNTNVDGGSRSDRETMRWRRTNRSIHELIGLARGLLADGELCANEVEALVQWFDSNPDAAGAFPGNVLAERLKRVCEDGRIDHDELRNLRIILQQMVGGVLDNGLLLAAMLPLNDPPPPVEYDSRVFVLTGHFAYGPRRICETAITDQGGRCASDVSMQSHYLVVGTFSSPDWAHSSYGRKVEKAVKLRSEGQPIAIISEDHWTASLVDVPMPHPVADGQTELDKLLRRTLADGTIDEDELFEIMELLFASPEVFNQAPTLKQILLEMSADGRCTDAERRIFEDHVRSLLEQSPRA